MSVKSIQADHLGAPTHWYWTCPSCGWCSPLKTGPAGALREGVAHEQAKDAS